MVREHRRLWVRRLVFTTPNRSIDCCQHVVTDATILVRTREMRQKVKLRMVACSCWSRPCNFDLQTGANNMEVLDRLSKCIVAVKESSFPFNSRFATEHEVFFLSRVLA
jgi:hypothetical protein